MPKSTTSSIPARSGIGPRLRKQRLEKGWTQQQLADRLGTAKSTVSQYENNVNEPDLTTLIRLSLLLEVSADNLLGLPETGSISEPAADFGRLVSERLAPDEAAYVLESLELYRRSLQRRSAQPEA